MTMKNSQDPMNSIFENIPLGIIVADKTGVVLHINSHFRSLTGYTTDDIHTTEDWFRLAYPDPSYRDIVMDDWKKSSQMKDRVAERRITCKNGQVKDIEFRGAFLPDGKALTTMADITDRKQGEKYLNYFKTAVELSSDAIGMADPEGRHWYQNQAFDDLFGDIGDDPPARVYVDKARGREIFETIMAGEPWIGEIEMYAKDSSVLSILLRAYAIKDGKGRVIGLVGTHTDMTSKKQSLKALRASEEKYRGVVENTPDLLYRTDLTGAIIFVSSSAFELSGYTVEESIGMKLEEEVYAVPEERNKFIETLKTHGVVKNFAAQLKRKDGSIWWASTNAYFSRDTEGNIIGVDGITRDITELKTAEAAIKASEERFKIAGKAAYDLIYEWDVKTDSLIWFGDIDSLLGYEAGEISSNITAWLELIHPEDVPMLENAVEFHRTATEPIKYNYRIKQKDGVWRNWKDVALPILSLENKPVRWVGICIDVTEIKKDELALRESEKQLRAILEASPDPMVMYDVKGFPQYLNPAFTEVFGWTLDELDGRIIPFVPEDQKKITIRMIKEIYGQRKPLRFETQRLTKDSKTLDIILSAAVTTDDNGEPDGVVVNLTDITERKALEAQYEQAQKMESLGTLAGGIAHDFNNLLGGIFGFLDLARKRTTEPRIKEYLNKAFNTASRAKGLTHQLLTFSKGGAPVKKIESLTPFLQETTQFALSGASVSSSFDLPDDLWMCDCDKNQIGQVIDNIVINAHHAMPTGGDIKVCAVNVSLMENEHPALSRGNYVRISITDTGLGIPEKYLSRIFDPFFTTKQKGSGLGLATSYSIIKRHNGTIDVDSEQGVGTTFHTFIPAAEDQKETITVITETDYKGSGCVLVMDDEEMIREMLTEMLAEMGFTSICTLDGNTAVEAFKKSQKENKAFCAVILDLTVPGGMGGKETVDAIRELDTQIPVFVASGYSEDSAIARPEEFGFTASLGKPFEFSELVKMFQAHLPPES